MKILDTKVQRRRNLGMRAAHAGMSRATVDLILKLATLSSSKTAGLAAHIQPYLEYMTA